MKNILKNLRLHLPEVLIALSATFCLVGDIIYSSTGFFTLLCAMVLLSLLVLVTWRNRFFALSLAFVFGFVSFCMLLAVLAEFMKFQAGQGWQLLIPGAGLFGGLTAASIYLPKKYIHQLQ
ncbi:MAG: hypothetical protein KIT80_11190 [Chitinophagaceae bacterium]|nr:hypothetical protein [Chitinophagaceae bacterium]MCW5927467.1 hypothetical protein [Chitinophagaceae bacterium]